MLAVLAVREAFVAVEPAKLAFPAAEAAVLETVSEAHGAGTYAASSNLARPLAARRRAA
jgi:hypothetical protein